jgi:sulfate adenylyltransferase subunit 1
VGVVDLTGEVGELVFDVTDSFLGYLGKGNRILFRLRDVGQLPAVALMAYEQTLSFEFDRTADGVSVLLFRRGTRVGDKVSDDGGTGI